MRLGVTLALGALSTLFSYALQAANWYVAPADSSLSAGDGRSAQRPWKGFRSVVWGPSGVKAGDTLYLSNGGTYREPLYITSSGTPTGAITVACSDGLSCLIDGGHRGHTGIHGENVSHIRVVGITAQNHINSGIRFHGASAGIRIEQCVASNNGYYGILIHAKQEKAQDIVIERNKVFYNGQQNLGAGIYITADNGGRVEGVTIRDNEAFGNNGRYGIGIYPQSGGVVTTVEVSGNLCRQNGSAGIDITKQVYDSNVHHNLCYQNGLNMPGAGIHLGGVRDYYPERIRVYENQAGFQMQHYKDGAGIMVDDYVRDVEVTRNVVIGNQESGVKLHNCSTVDVSGNTVMGNPVGIFTPSADDYRLIGNLVAHSTQVGILVADSARTAVVSDNLVMHSDTGIQILRGAGQVTESGNCLRGNRVDVVDARSGKKEQVPVSDPTCMLSRQALGLGE